MKTKTFPTARSSTKILQPALFFVALFLGTTVGFGQTTWFGGTNKTWSVNTNWSTGASPASTAVVFSGSGSTANATTIGNIVDQNFTINSLTYNNTSNWQVTQIASGQTLTIDAGATTGNSLLVGGFSASATTTQAALTGSGTFAISSTNANITVSNTGFTAGKAILDMSALATFTAHVNSFNVGTGATGFGTVYLADNSTITAATLSTGGSGSGYGAATSDKLYFGTTTTLNIDTLAFAGGRTFGLVQFRTVGAGAANNTTVSGATLTIRGSAGGSSRASIMTVGDINGALPSGGGSSSLNLTDGSVDALVGTLTVGNSSAALTNNMGASLSMAAGNFDTTTAIIGQTTSTTTGSGTMTGNLIVSGGTFTAGSLTLANNTGTGDNRAAKGNLTVSGAGIVNVTGSLVVGNRTAATVSGTINVSGGALNVGSGISEGTGAAASINSTINLSAGVLNMSHSNIAVDTFNFTGGTLKNAATVTIGTGALQVQNSATLAYDLNGSFTPLTLIGTLNLSASTNLSLTLADNFTPVSETLVSNDLVDAITGTFATINGAAFDAGNTFTLTNNLGSFEFALSYAGGDGNDLVMQAVPEPGTWGMILGGFGMLVSFQKLRKRRMGV